jgi:SAM-dependent methyltransferase
VNEGHRVFLASSEWREMLENQTFPFSFGPFGCADLGDDVLEVGPGPGLTTDLLRAQLARLTAIELDDELAGALTTRLAGTNVNVVHGDATRMPFDDRHFSGAVSFNMLHHVPEPELQDRLFANVLRVLKSGGLLIATDSVPSDLLAEFHADDIYNPIDPATLPDRLVRIGFTDIDVETNEYAWAVRARRPE